VMIDDIRVRVATPRILYVMKKDTVAARRADAARIREVFGIEED